VKVTFGRRAAGQLASIFAHIAKDNPRAATEVVARIEEIAACLADFPGLGQPSRRESRLRWLAVPDYPCLIFYTILRDRTVRIVRVIHAARQRHRP
jgi:plasmid stabilization system protein ParE